MTLSAGLDNILARKGRFRFIGREDIMRPVAIIALGRGRISELGDFAVERFEIGLGDILVAVAALVENVQFESLGIGAGDSM